MFISCVVRNICIIRKNKSKLGVGKKMKHAGTIAFLVAIIGVGCVALMLFGARLGLWEPITGFGLYRNYLNILGFIVAGVGLAALIIHLTRQEKSKAMLGGIAMIFGFACLGPMVATVLNPPVRGAPIHNISTDTVNPPEFLVLDEHRAGASNPLEYGGPELAAARAAAYPDIGPLEAD